jgi:phosphate transport system substrate-binding protein
MRNGQMIRRTLLISMLYCLLSSPMVNTAVRADENEAVHEAPQDTEIDDGTIDDSIVEPEAALPNEPDEAASDASHAGDESADDELAGSDPGLTTATDDPASEANEHASGGVADEAPDDQSDDDSGAAPGTDAESEASAPSSDEGESGAGYDGSDHNTEEWSFDGANAAVDDPPHEDVADDGVGGSEVPEDADADAAVTDAATDESPAFDVDDPSGEDGEADTMADRVTDESIEFDTTEAPTESSADDTTASRAPPSPSANPPREPAPTSSPGSQAAAPSPQIDFRPADGPRLDASTGTAAFVSVLHEELVRSSDLWDTRLRINPPGTSLAMFCNGVGPMQTDTAMEARRMDPAERDACQRNDVTAAEMPFGYDAVVLAQARDRPAFSVSRAQLFQALAAEVEVNGTVMANPHSRWSDIDPALPDSDIRVVGPSPGSEIHAMWMSVIMENGCAAFPAITALDAARRSAVCRTLRADPIYVEAGEDPAQIAQRLQNDSSAIGIVTYSAMDAFSSTFSAVAIDGVEPSTDNVQAGRYLLNIELVAYIKTNHVGVIKGLREFACVLTADRSVGPEGRLVDKGMIPLATAQRAESIRVANGLNGTPCN